MARLAPGMYKPYSAEAIDIYSGHYSPNTRIINSRSFWFWVRAFFGRAQSVIDLNVIPEWNNDTLDVLYCWLFREGFVGVLDSDTYGLVFQLGSLNGRDLYYRPNRFIIANANAPELNGDYKINENIAILKLTPDYCSTYDIVKFYAEKMAMLDNAINISIENLKLTKVVTAQTKAASATLKKIADKANKGESLVVVDDLLENDRDGKSPLNFYDLPNIKNSYILTDQLEDMKTIIDMFDAEIGIPTLLQKKRERLVSNEAQYDQSSARAEIWVRTLNKCFEKINEMFDVEMSAKLHYNYNKGVQNNVNNDADRTTV